MQHDFDLLIIGAGSAGYSGAALAQSLGLRVALIDGADQLGGLCILRGCMPSKALLAGANRFRQATHSQDFGITLQGASIDLPTLIARKNHHVADFAQYRRDQIHSGKFPFIHGYAKFLDGNTIEITTGLEQGRRITASHFLLATGSHLRPPRLPGLVEVGFQHSDTILDNPHLPKSVIVLGAGAVALEFASYYNALGSQVTILQRSEHLLRGSDHETAHALRVAMEKQGITIQTNTTLVSASVTDSGKKITYIQSGQSLEIIAEEIFYALGRHPNLDQLGLDSAGITPYPHRPTQQTNQDQIFIAGDASGPYEVVHIAIQQAELAIRNIARLLKKDSVLEEMNYRNKLFVLFTHPELAQVGLSEEEARELKLDILTSSYRFDDHGKSLVMGETDGLVKLVALRTTGEILGASVVGPEAASLIHEIVPIIHYHGTAADLMAMPHYHPTLSEIWTYPAEDLAAKVTAC